MIKSPAEAPNGWAASIVGLIEALLVAMVGSGMLIMTNDQIQMWVNVAVAIAGVVTPLIGFWWASKQQTPYIAPKDVDGRHLLRVDGSVPIAQAIYEAKKK